MQRSSLIKIIIIIIIIVIIIIIIIFISSWPLSFFTFSLQAQ